MTPQQPKTKHLRLFDGASWLLQRVSVPKSQERQLRFSPRAGATFLRRIGDQLLRRIDAKLPILLDEATDAWGIKVKRVELKNILPPREIQVAMEKQMKAERERRARILDAEGEKTSQILVAEGHKEAAILRAEAVKETKIREAQGEAEAIIAVQTAYADSLRMLNAAAPNDKVIALKSLETFAQVADGRATKIIIPSEIQSMAGLATTLKELIVDGNVDNSAKTAPDAPAQNPVVPKHQNQPQTKPIGTGYANQSGGMPGIPGALNAPRVPGNTNGMMNNMPIR